MITTFDNKQWNKEELLANMFDDSFYYGYLGQNALSSSSIKTLVNSPKTYYFTTKYGSGETQALRDGKLFHTMILEPEKLNDIIFVDAATKASKEYKLAKETGKEVYTNSELKAAERLTDALLRNEAVKEYLTNAEFEVPQIAMIDGIPIRVKADILKGNTIIDLKTTTGIKDFRYSADKYSYDLQAWLYREMFGVENFVFVVIDKGSLDIAIFECSDEFYARGKQKFEQGISNYKYFFQTEGVDLDQYVLRGVL
jgi:PDDEXK-like domain of unknown function (DUF3799)